MAVQPWEAVLAAALVLVLLVFYVPRMRASMGGTPRAGAREWLGALIPLGAVVLFVVLLVALV